MLIKKEILREILWKDEYEGWKSVKDTEEYVDRSRWSTTYTAIVESPEGRFYRTTYSVGSTEIQDESPYEYSPDEIECPEVKLVKVLVDKWKEVK